MSDWGVRITLAAGSPVPAYDDGGLWDLGVAKICSGEEIGSGWTNNILVGCSALGESADLARGGNYAEASEASIVLATVLETTKWWEVFEAAGASIYGAQVEVGILTGVTFAPRWWGVVTEREWIGLELTLTVESQATRRHKEIPLRTVSNIEFPAIEEGSKFVVPFAYGAVQGIQGQNLQSECRYNGLRTYTDASTYLAAELTHAFTGAFSINSTDFASVVYAIKAHAGADPSPSGMWPDAWSGGVVLYMEVAGGTGSGQKRKVANLSTSTQTVDGIKIFWALITPSIPFDTALDATSTVKFTSIANLASIAIADEATIAQVRADVKGAPFRVPHSQDLRDGIVFADVSSEYVADQLMAAVDVVSSTSNYGVAELSDRVSQSGRTIKTHKNVGFSSGNPFPRYSSDGFCRGRLWHTDIPREAINNGASLAICISLDASAMPDRGPSVTARTEVVVRAFDFLGNRYEINALDLTDVSADFCVPKLANAFSPDAASDGQPDNYTVHRVSFDLPIALSAVREIRYCAAIVDAEGYEEPIWRGTVSPGSNVVNVTYAPTGMTFSVGDYIRPYAPASDSHGWIDPVPYNAIYKAGAWQQVSGIGYLALTVSDASIWEAATDVSFVRVRADQMIDVVEREVAVAFEYGDIPIDSSFVADLSYGRTFGAAWSSLPPGEVDGNRIVFASHAALDIAFRDLGLSDSDIDKTSFLALPSAEFRLIQSERGSSAKLFADMAREYGWVVAHDSSGRITARNLFASVGTTTHDYEVTTSEIKRDSVASGATSIDDVVTLPTFSTKWTQEKGFAQSFGIKSLAIDPVALNASNYRDYLFGFDSFYSDVADFYATFYQGAQRSGREQSGEIEIRFHDGNLGYGMMVDLYPWISQRKRIIEFQVPDTHAAASGHVGQRIKLTHKRYAKTPAYGTIAGLFWLPESRSVQITLLIDPPPSGEPTESGWSYFWGTDFGGTP